MLIGLGLHCRKPLSYCINKYGLSFWSSKLDGSFECHSLLFAVFFLFTDIYLLFFNKELTEWGTKKSPSATKFLCGRKMMFNGPKAFQAPLLGHLVLMTNILGYVLCLAMSWRLILGNNGFSFSEILFAK